MKWKAIERVASGSLFTPAWRLESLYWHILNAGCERVLELGTGFGYGTATIAAALHELGRGKVVTVDLQKPFFNLVPSVEETVARLGLNDYVEVVREKSSYIWWLMPQVERAVEPYLDLVYMDGSHHLTHDLPAFEMCAQLMKVGAWILFDDYGWRFADGGRNAENRCNDGGFDYGAMSEYEQHTPHVKLLVDCFVARDHRFERVSTNDGWWWWARKASD